MGCQAVFSPLVFDSRLFLFLMPKRGFVEKIVKFLASDLMVYWSLTGNSAYVERKMY